MWVNVKPKTRRAREQLGASGTIYVERIESESLMAAGKSLSTKEVEWQPVVNSDRLKELNNGKGQENRTVQTR